MNIKGNVIADTFLIGLRVLVVGPRNRLELPDDIFFWLFVLFRLVGLVEVDGADVDGLDGDLFLDAFELFFVGGVHAARSRDAQISL